MNMHEDNIDTLCKEANRLLEVNLHLLTSLQSEQGVLYAPDPKKEAAASYDTDSIVKVIEIINGEQEKLKQLDMVLAVVGTMKAGKSTTINAIIGTEVLPNRNRPMTAIPTLIRHTPGQHQPELHFENAKPINLLFSRLQSALKTPKGKQNLKSLEHDRDMDQLLTMISTETQLKSIYQGADEIFQFLRSLNDLVRLSTALGTDFPFDDYDEMHELPVIKVEFASLRGIEQAKGNLTLLDTPGPNEAGQGHLKKMLKDQLSKASAVMAILDYTQLKSDADAEVRDNLKDIFDAASSNIYALVNKFDQHDRHSDSLEQVKAYVAKQLMQGILQEDHVFPVSSRSAYLASRALHELELNQTIPDPTSEPWVIDFGKEAIGRCWEKVINKPAEVKQAANELWDNSLYSLPLEMIIKSAHAQAAILAVQSACNKLLEHSTKMNNQLNVRESALSKSAQELQFQISSLLSDIDHLKNSEKQAQANIKTLREKLRKETTARFDASKKDLAQVLNDYFAQGKLKENSRVIKLRKEEKKEYQGILSFLSTFSALFPSSNTPEGADFNPNSDTIKFDSAKDAEQFVLTIETRIRNIMDATNKYIRKTMDEQIDVFKAEMEITRADASTMIGSIKKRLSGEGFKIEFVIPELDRTTLQLSVNNMFEDLVSSRTEQKTRYRRQEGVWGRVCSWFGTDDWGWESYSVSETHYEINLPKVRNNVLNGVDQTFKGLGDSIVTYIEKPIQKSTTEFFATLKSAVESIRGDLLQSCRDKEKSQASQTELLSRLSSMKKKVPLHDVQQLRAEIKEQLASA